MGSELRGRTLGIIGLGHSGRELARLVAPFQLQLLAYSPHAEVGEAAALNVRLTTLDELLTVSDFVSVHARLRQDNHRMIGARELALMKSTAYFINVARGELIDQPALFNVLRERRIAGAGLDVFQEEPLPLDDPLLKLDNVMLTPHWCASTTDVWRATGEATAGGMLRAARGEVPADLLNPEVLANRDFRTRLEAFVENQG
jgi:phosphoglycerate dehydrogenase-like enzyme